MPGRCDMCLSCHDKMSLQRSLLPSTQAEVNNRMSSVAEDPHETKTPPCEGDDCTWYKEYTTRPRRARTSRTLHSSSACHRATSSGTTTRTAET